MTNLSDLMPKHNCELILSHNSFKNSYLELREWSDIAATGTWVSDEQQAKALYHGEVWECQWYPDTPIGFYCLMGYDLEVVLEAARAFQN